LFTGAVGPQAGGWLLQSGGRLKAQWLLACHHGSANGSSLAFLAAVQPGGLISSAGFNNSYGHPSKKVLERAEYLRVNHNASGGSGSGYKEYNTAGLGAITLTSYPEDASRWRIRGQREVIPRRWLWQP